MLCCKFFASINILKVVKPNAFLSLRVFAVRNIGDIFNYSISHALCLLEAHFRIKFVLVFDGCFDSLGLNAISKAFLTHWHFQRGIL